MTETKIDQMVANGTTRDGAERLMAEASVPTGTVKECGSVLSAIGEIKHRAGLSPQLWTLKSTVEAKKREIADANFAAYMAARKGNPKPRATFWDDDAPRGYENEY